MRRRRATVGRLNLGQAGSEANSSSVRGHGGMWRCDILVIETSKPGTPLSIFGRQSRGFDFKNAQKWKGIILIC